MVRCELKNKSGLMSGCLDPRFFVNPAAAFGWFRLRRNLLRLTCADSVEVLLT